MTNERLKKVMVELNKITSDEIVGVSYGFKTTGGKTTNERSVVFTVIRKKPLSEIPKSERIPDNIIIDDESIPTDVIEGLIHPYAFDYCDPAFYSWQTTPPTNRNKHRPILGGTSVTNFTALGNYVGTLGFIAVDNETNSLVGVSNNHVLIDDAFYTTDRDLNGIKTNVWTPSGNSVTQPNEFFDSGIDNTVGVVKKYQPIKSVPFNNEIDCALVAVDSLDFNDQTTIDTSVSWKQEGILGMTSPPRFATTEELDTMFANPNQQYYSSGRTTGAKGEGDTKLYCVANSSSILIQYNRQGQGTTVYMNDTFELQAKGSTTPTGDWCYFPSHFGDSGSAILTKLDDGQGGIEWVIVGILYGGRSIEDPNNPGQRLSITSLCSRIDNIASSLNISAWDGTFNGISFSNKSNALVHVEEGGSDEPFKIIEGLKYWQMGLVVSQVPTPTPSPTPVPVAPVPSPIPTPVPVTPIPAPSTPIPTPVPTPVPSTPVPSPVPVPVAPVPVPVPVTPIPAPVPVPVPVTPIPVPVPVPTPIPTPTPVPVTPVPVPSVSYNSWETTDCLTGDLTNRVPYDDSYIPGETSVKLVSGCSLIGFPSSLASEEVPTNIFNDCLSCNSYDPSSGVFKATFDTRNTAAGSSDSSSLRLPKLSWNNDYNATIDWGDGNTSTVTYGNDSGFNHSYIDPGVYQISITGTFPAGAYVSNNDKLKLLSIDDWGNGDYYIHDNTAGLFQGCANLDLSNVKGVPNLGNDMSSMFMGCTNLTTIKNINAWDTSVVTQRMSQTFYGATSFNDDLNNWDVSNAISLDAMFVEATSFNGSLSGWSFGEGANLSSMFYNTTSFNRDISNWDVSLVDNMDGMFSGASSFNQDLSPWCVTNISSRPSGFDSNATAWVLSRPVWGTCPQTTTTTTTSIPFDYLYLQPNGVTISAKPEAVSGQEYEFNGVNYLVVADRDAMLPLWGNGRNLSTVCTTRVTNMFNLLNNKNSFSQDISSWDTSNVTNMDSLFYQATDLDVDISNWDTSNVTDMKYMFTGASGFNSDISGWDTSNVTNMKDMFAYATDFNADISNWDVSNVTSMSSMFQDAISFNQDLSNWCVSNISSKPLSFDGRADAWTLPRPVWGTCPPPTPVPVPVPTPTPVPVPVPTPVPVAPIPVPTPSSLSCAIEASASAYFPTYSCAIEGTAQGTLSLFSCAIEGEASGTKQFVPDTFYNMSWLQSYSDSEVTIDAVNSTSEELMAYNCVNRGVGAYASSLNLKVGRIPMQLGDQIYDSNNLPKDYTGVVVSRHIAVDWEQLLWETGKIVIPYIYELQNGIVTKIIHQPNDCSLDEQIQE